MASADHNPNNGRFAKGNQLGGIPFGKRISEMRSLLYASTSNADMLAIWANIVACAQDRSDKEWLKAAGIVFERLLGAPPDGEMEEKVARLETLVETFIAQRGQKEEAA